MSILPSPPPSLERLRKFYSYDPESGHFTRLVNRRRSARLPNRYVNIRIDGRFYSAHRLAWLWVHGTWPPEIDHLNRDKADNRISNLRAATPALNALNRELLVTNRSGVAGVRYLDGRRSPWHAFIRVNGKQITLGFFAEKERAAGVRAAAFKLVERFQAAAARNAGSQTGLGAL
jgi:hypothetical protein